MTDLQVEGQTDQLSYARKDLKASWFVLMTLRVSIVCCADSIDDVSSITIIIKGDS